MARPQDSDGRLVALDHRFAADPGEIGPARRLLGGWLGRALTGQDRLIGDIVLATGEACNNAVLHAYRSSNGNGDGRSVRIVAEQRGSGVRVTVSDEGDGMSPRSRSHGMGLGLPLIGALADSVRIGPGAGSVGTAVVMQFQGEERR